MVHKEKDEQPPLHDAKGSELGCLNLPYLQHGDDSRMEKRVWRKLDIHLLPLTTMFYFLSFLVGSSYFHPLVQLLILKRRLRHTQDRANIGNARVAGLQKDLKMSNTQYSVALTVTFLPYIVTELPSNLLLKIVGPHLMLPTMLTFWGIITTLQGIGNRHTKCRSTYKHEYRHG